MNNCVVMCFHLLSCHVQTRMSLNKKSHRCAVDKQIKWVQLVKTTSLLANNVTDERKKNKSSYQNVKSPTIATVTNS